MPVRHSWRALCPEVVEHTEQIAIQVDRGEFVQTPWLRLRRGHQSRFASTPKLIQLIHVLFAFQIQPSHCRSNVAVYFSILLVRQKHSTVAFRDACQSEFVSTLIKSETEIILVVSRRLIDILHRYFGNGAGKLRFHQSSARRPRPLGRGSAAPFVVNCLGAQRHSLRRANGFAL
jgi:hypothetical protein